MIKEFDLDAPSLSRDARSEFRYQTRSVTSLFERCFDDKLVLGSAWKVLVEVVPSITHKKYRNLLGVLVVQVESDPFRLLDIDGSDEKNELALSWLLQGSDQIAEEFGLGKTNFHATAAKVSSMGYRNIRIWKKPVLSPDGSRQVEVVVEHGVYEARLIGRIRHANGNIINERILTSEKPDEFIYAPLLGSLKWLDNFNAELTSVNGDKSWRI